MAKSEKRKKPRKPYRLFPLTAHNNGQWCKKIRGKVHFFGVWADPNAAHDRYLRISADLHAGRKPDRGILSGGELTIKDVANHYLTYQQSRSQNGEITPRWFDDCLRTAKHFTKFTGTDRLISDVLPEDFHQYHLELIRRGLTGKRGLDTHALDRSIVIVKAMFDHAYQTNLMKEAVRFGTAFRRSSADAKRKSKAHREIENGKRLFEPKELRALITAADAPLRAMILLGINGGLGTTDCAKLPISAIKYDKAIIEFPRPKTGIERVIPLWPNTIEAIQAVMTRRPEPKGTEEKALCFLTASGHAWVRHIIHANNEAISRFVRVDVLGQKFDKLLRKLNLKRKGVGFYALRHTFRTWADEVRDQHAIYRIMGHNISGMAGIYVETIGLERLVAVTEHVREKLFGELGVSLAEVSGPASVT
jgi:integrase